MTFQQRLAREEEEAAAQRVVHARPVPNLHHTFHPRPAAKVGQ